MEKEDGIVKSTNCQQKENVGSHTLYWSIMIMAFTDTGDAPCRTLELMYKNPNRKRTGLKDPYGDIQSYNERKIPEISQKTRKAAPL